jgi:Na+-translocating ferredoxin:NAD+ oxidoreductase RNF subunit RnfB
MNEKDLIKNFSITNYGKLSKFNDVISMGRCRIFYKGANRNGSYITDEFAEKLIATAPYTPVKGIYTEEIEDYEDHGEKRTEGRIYGVVPAEPNFAWEKHTDEDGVEREYACVDVLYYTGLYPEAGQIDGKSQSMELYGPSIKGDWQIIDGKKNYVFTEGCFLGLQVLGDKVEPCFEGAAFFSLCESLKELVEKMEKFNYNKGGRNEMIKRISELLNAEAEKYSVYNIVENETKTAYLFNLEENKFQTCNFTVGEDDAITLEEITDCFMFEATEAEYNSLVEIKEAAIDFSTVKETYASVETLKNDKNVLEQKIVDYENDKSTLVQERDDARTNFENAQQTITDLQNTVNSLEEFKKTIEDSQKKSIVEKYSTKLTEEQMKSVTDNIDNYSIVDLEKELAYIFCANFSFDSSEPKVPKHNETNPLSEILGKYEKK